MFLEEYSLTQIIANNGSFIQSTVNSNTIIHLTQQHPCIISLFQQQNCLTAQSKKHSTQCNCNGKLLKSGLEW